MSRLSGSGRLEVLTGDHEWYCRVTIPRCCRCNGRDGWCRERVHRECVGLVHDPAVSGGDVKPVGTRRCIIGYRDVATDQGGTGRIEVDWGQGRTGGLVREYDNSLDCARLKVVPVTVNLTVVFLSPETGVRDVMVGIAR